MEKRSLFDQLVNGFSGAVGDIREKLMAGWFGPDASPAPGGNGATNANAPNPGVSRTNIDLHIGDNYTIDSINVDMRQQSVRAEATNLLNEIEGLGGNQQASLSHEKSALAFAAASGIMVWNFERIRSQIAAAKGAEDKAELMDNPEQRKARLWAEIEQLNGRIRAEFQGLKPYLSKEQIDKENKAARELQDANEELQRLRESGASREAIAAAEARYLAASKGAATVAQETTVLVEANPAAPEHAREAAKRRDSDAKRLLSKADEHQRHFGEGINRIADDQSNALDSLISPSAVPSPPPLAVVDATPAALGKLDSPTTTTSNPTSGKARQ